MKLGPRGISPIPRPLRALIPIPTHKRSRPRRYGAENARVATLPTGESKGFGYVRFPDYELAEGACAAMNGAEIEGKKLRVSAGAARALRTSGAPGWAPSRGGILLTHAVHRSMPPALE